MKPASLKNIAFDTGVIAERKRIVKLLSSLDISFEGDGETDYIVGDALDLIALIEGEK
jgi:hypothetical protein